MDAITHMDGLSRKGLAGGGEVCYNKTKSSRKGGERMRTLATIALSFAAGVFAAVLLGVGVWQLWAAGACLLAGLGWLIVNDVCALNKAPLTATVEIEKGDSVGQIASKLKKAGIIKYKLLFVITSPLFHAKDTIQPGSYELNTDMDYNCIIDSMQQGSSVAGTVKVTIPEGYSVQETIQLLADSDVSNVEDLTEAAKNHVFDKFDFVDNENLGSISRLEGYLFPDTYEFYVKENADSALSRLLANFQDRIVDDPDLAPLIANSSYSLKEIVIMASLIEKETDGTDRTLISSVIHNRLENVGETAHLLQIDASLVYAAGREITEDDYQTLDSPYNLYTHQGLPPTAIANAGKASIQAALQPDDTNYYFYVLNPDTQRHVFSRTLSEHNANLRKFG